ncbi:MAG: ABC transporter ATP-binding protein [Planctomycetes bacterium]|nr:ABC transporter ATP-binding protein [Planctomycetota bacterium]
MTAPVLVAALDVSRRFRGTGPAPVEALLGVTLEVERGAFVALVGPSGSGKSTLLALLGALDRPTSGRVVFDGADLLRASDAARTRVRRRIGIVFQGGPTLRRVTAVDNVGMPLVARGVPAAEREARARAALGRVGLADRAGSPPEELSGGELQRLGVARALVGDPELVLADEPTSSLDRENAAAVADLLSAAHAEGRTVVVATHDDALVARATRVVELAHGRVVADRRR